MKRIMLSAMHSGAGKTVAVCALLAALKRRGMDVRAYKCGPDYIDPMFHARVLGVPSRNLDLFLQGEDGVRRSLKQCSGDIAVLEGAMGYYDGVAATADASAWDVAVKTDTPVILVLRPKGVGLSLAAQVRGMLQFRQPSQIAGLLLTDCKAHLAEYLTPMLARETGLPVLGYLPPMDEAKLESRHLGLQTPDEIEALTARFETIAAQLERTVDLDRLLSLAADGETAPAEIHTAAASCRIAVARDEAFCFAYADSIDALRNAGAELVFFSPLRDKTLPPEIDGLYLCGGYPELYAALLSQNETMRASVRDAVQKGLATIAECGGFLYLLSSLEDAEGAAHPMCGVLPGAGVRTGRLQRFGYAWLETDTDSMLFRAGERVPVHEFHYWDSTQNGSDLRAVKPNGRQWSCAFATPRLYAGFPHLPLGGETPLAERFVRTCQP